MSRPSCCPPGGNDKPQTEALQHAHEQAYARPHSVVPTQTADPLSDSHSEARAGRDDYHGDVHYSAHGHSEPRSHSQPHEDGHDDGDGHDHSGHSHSRTPHQDPFLPGETAAEAHCVDHSCSAPIEELVDEGEGCCTGHDHGGHDDHDHGDGHDHDHDDDHDHDHGHDHDGHDHMHGDKIACCSELASTVGYGLAGRECWGDKSCPTDQDVHTHAHANAHKHSPHDSDSETKMASSVGPLHDTRRAHVHAPCRKTDCTTRQRRRADGTMCACCVKAMMTQENVSLVRSLMDAAMQMHIAARRCCIAFAAYCCPRPTECSQLIGEQKCGPADDELVALLSDMEDYGATAAAKEKSAATTVKTETFTLEVSGMDCPDCLAKVRKAFESLPGATIKKIDFIRGIVEVERDETAADVEIIGRFVARASGFTIRVVYSSPSDGPRSALPVRFERMPPPEVLAKYETTDVRDNEATFVFRRGEDQSPPRNIMANLAEYGPYLAPPGTSREASRINADVRALAIRTLLCAILTIPILVLVWTPIPGKGSIGYRAAEFALATGVFILAFPIYAGSFRTIWYLRQADLGVLTAVSTLTTYLFSIVAFAFQAAHNEIAEPFFETLGLLITLIYLGRTIQASTRKAALSAISSLSKLQPERALLVTDGKEEDIDARLLFYGDTVRISAGGVIPTDGVVFSGSADVDESAVTGESVPVIRGPGQTVHTGTTVLNGEIDIAVSRLTSENSLASVIHAVMDAQSSNSRFSDLADRVAAWLLPIASFTAFASFIVWLFALRYVRHKPWGNAVLEAVTYAIAVMAVSCPCALTLAVPTISATLIAMGVKDGVVFRSSEALLSLSTVRSFAFDKTGTLSLGTLSIVEAFTGYEHDLLTTQLVTHMTSSKRHPVSVAVNQYLSTGQGDNQPTFDIEYTDVPGGGMQGDFYGFPVLGGSAKFTHTTQHPLVKRYLDSGYTVFVVTVGNQVVAAFGLADKERTGTARLVDVLAARNGGSAVTILSGDHQAAVSAFARRIGSAQAVGGLSPSGKAAAIADLQDAGGDKKTKVAFVGDGVNDSIALSRADIGIGMGSGTDAAVLASSVVLLGTDLYRTMMAALDLAALARIHAMLGLAWCGIYFFVALLLASGATIDARIPPQYAGLGEMVSVAPVLLLAVSAWAWRKFQRV